MQRNFQIRVRFENFEERQIAILIGFFKYAVEVTDRLMVMKNKAQANLWIINFVGLLFRWVPLGLFRFAFCVTTFLLCRHSKDYCFTVFALCQKVEKPYGSKYSLLLQSFRLGLPEKINRSE